MWKRAIIISLCLILMCAPRAYAADQRAVVSEPTLSFTGSTATCKYTLSSFGKTIDITMELWRGSTLIDSWHKTGTSVVSLNESCSVTCGLTYTLKVTGTCGGVAISPTSVTKTCPRS